jgi:hypothetical protein
VTLAELALVLREDEAIQISREGGVICVRYSGLDTRRQEIEIAISEPVEIVERAKFPIVHTLIATALRQGRERTS